MTERIANEELLLRYLDNSLAEGERQQLEMLLRKDAATRDLLRELALHAVVAADVARVQGAPAADVTPRTGKISATLRWGGWSAVAAVAIGLLIGLYWDQRSPEILQVKRIHGTIRWTGDGGRVTHRLVKNQRLPGGTLEALSADSWVELQFRDHSTVTLAGRSVVTLSEQEQKEIHVRRGSLSAVVQPQPSERPMVVHTRTADLQVLGTQFDVDVLSASTRLTVNKGRVRLKRTADGKQVEVPAHYEVVASHESETPLVLQQRSSHVTEWTSDLENDVKYGKWISDLWQQTMQLKKAVTLGEMTKAEAFATYARATSEKADAGSVWAQPSSVGGLIVLTVRNASDHPVMLTPQAKLQLTGHVHSVTDVEFGFTTSNPNGGFAGKYSMVIKEDSLRGNDQGFELELPANEFQEITGSDVNPSGKELRDFWCVTKDKSAKLEITSVKLVE